jgi:hypothetical protein
MEEMSARSDSDDRLTIAAIAVLAFVVADVAHEVIGHGLGFFIAGGRSGVFTTTQLMETQRLGGRGADIFDLGGPFGNLVFAAVPWLALRLLRPRAPRFRLLLWLVMAFSLFWAFGYLILCGVVDRGDWFALIRGAKYLWLWRVVFVAAGIVLYRASEKLLATELRWSRPRVPRMAFTAYVAGGLIACAGAALDPRGSIQMLASGALTSFAGAIGLLRVPRLVLASGETQAVAIRRSFGWVLCAAAVSIFYIGVLGPGIGFTW